MKIRLSSCLLLSGLMAACSPKPPAPSASPTAPPVSAPTTPAAAVTTPAAPAEAPVASSAAPATEPEAGSAGRPNGGGNRGAGMKAMMDKLKTDLNLTPDQATKFDAITADSRQQMMQLRSDESVPQDQKMQKFKALRDDSNQKINAMLTPDQQKTYAAFQEQMKSQMKGRRGAGGGGGGHRGGGHGGGAGPDATAATPAPSSSPQ